MKIQSLWRQPQPQLIKLNQLTPSVVHSDLRHKTKTTPSMKTDGLWYPLCCVKMTLELWQKQIVNNTKSYLKPATINSDNLIWVIKVGCNRYFSALELGATEIDCVFFSDTDQAVKMARWYQQCNPLHNQNCQPYLGKFDYF